MTKDEYISLTERLKKMQNVVSEICVEHIQATTR